MLQELLTLIREAQGLPISRDAITAQLGLAPDVVEHMLWLLVQRGRLSVVEEGCVGCDACPLKRYCAGAPAMGVRGYIARERWNSPL